MSANIQIIRYQDCESSLWKNGGGSTKQLLISPKDADLSNFDFRISIATISSDGPFSQFIGIDRQLCILEGAGVKLKMMSDDATEANELILRPNEAAFCFSGETQIESQLLDKQIIDFNVMTKRGKYRAHIERLEFDGFLQLTASTNHNHDAQHPLHQHKLPQQWLLCLAPISFIYHGETIQLQRYDMLLCPQGHNSKAQPSQIPRLEVATPKANHLDAGQPKIKQTDLENKHPLNHKQNQVLRIVIECKKGSRL